MTRKTNKAAAAKTAALVAAAVAVEPTLTASDDAEGFVTRKGSVVKRHYKMAYKAAGHSRGNGDALFVLLRGLTLNAAGKTDLAALAAVAVANGVTPDYANRSPGWEGRYRMTVGLRLRPVVARQGFLVGPDGERYDVTDETFLAKHRPSVPPVAE